MRWTFVLLLVIPACTDDVDYGEVKALGTAGGRVQLTACLDAELFTCHGQDVTLVAEHAGQTTVMPFGGFLQEHVAFVDLEDRTAPFVIRDGDREVVMTLPAPFEIGGVPSATLAPGDHLALSWAPDAAPMRWDVTFACPHGSSMKTGSVTSGTIVDDGAVELAIDDVVRALQAKEVTDASCRVRVQLSRVNEGSVDAGFRADRGTAIERRTIEAAFTWGTTR